MNRRMGMFLYLYYYMSGGNESPYFTPLLPKEGIIIVIFLRSHPFQSVDFR
jgi:hypothetical protein